MLKRLKNLCFASLTGLALWLPASAYSAQAEPEASADAEQAASAASEDKAASEGEDKNQSKSQQQPTPAKGEDDNTIWLEEKLNPSTQWLEKTVKPLTRWLEGQVQLKPKPAPPNSGDNKAAPRASGAQVAAGDGGKAMSRSQIRQLLSQRYRGEVLHIKALGQGAQRRYRAKLISPEGVVKIIYLNAIDGSEIKPQ